MRVKVEIEGDSEEAVAFALLQMVAQAEGKLDEDGALQGVDRDWILDAYTECRLAVEGGRLLMEEDDEAEEDELEADELDEEEDQDEDERDRPVRS